MRTALLGLALLAATCGVPPARGSAGRPLVVTTISILADFVEAVGGERIEVRSIVPIAGDPHVYEPTPSDARLAADADLIVRNGLGLERWLDKLIESAGGVPVVTATDGLTAIVEESGTYAGDPDPHMWMDPSLARHYVETIRDALVDLDPPGREAYRANAERYLRELAELDTWIEAQSGSIPPQNRKLVTTHDAFRYFGVRYGLEVVGTIWSISTEREPSADEIRRLVDAVREHGVLAVFVETTISPKLMEQVARDAGVTVGEPLYGDSVGEPGGGAETYVGMMRHNAEAIVSALGGEVRG